MDESIDNINNERIYESIADCVKRSFDGRDHANTSAGHQDAPFSLGAMHPSTAGASCYGINLTNTTATAKRAFKTGAEKLCGTVNTVCTKFGTLSQKLRRSTRRRTPLVNSPETPARTSRAQLGRTPTKMYSPFSIDTPRGKENSTARRSLNREAFKKVTPPRNRGVSIKRKVFAEDLLGVRASPRLNKELRDTQIGVYELHNTAERILTNLRR